MGSRALRIVTCLAAIGALIAPVAWHLRTIASIYRARLAYPSSLEWMEDGLLYEARRMLAGLPVYGPPSQHFVPYPYPPVYFAVVAAVGRWVGVINYATGRAVCMGAVALVAVLLAGTVLRHSRRHLLLGGALAIAGVASLAAAEPLCVGTIETIRTDALGLAFVVIAASLVDAGRIGRARATLIAAALTAAVYTKQTEVFFAIWITIFVARRDLAVGLWLGGATLGLSATALAALELTTHGWFGVWLFDMKGSSVEYANLGPGLGRTLQQAPFLVLVPSIVFALGRSGALHPRTRFWCGMLVAALPATFLPLLKRFGWFNNLTPLVALAWPVTSLVILDLVDAWRERFARFVALQTGAVLGAAGLLRALEYDPARFIPTADDTHRSEALQELVRSLGGHVLFPMRPCFPPLDDTPQLALMGYLDARDNGMPGMDLALREAFDASGAEWLVKGGWEAEDWMIDQAAASYHFERHLDLRDVLVTPLPEKSADLYRRNEPTGP